MAVIIRKDTFASNGRRRRYLTIIDLNSHPNDIVANTVYETTAYQSVHFTKSYPIFLNTHRLIH